MARTFRAGNERAAAVTAGRNGGSAVNGGG